jgi:SAM-dependent methyltransferase
VAVGPLDLGDEVLEIGPGYGASTRVLVEAVPRLTALEVDESLAVALSTSYPGVTVVQGSGDDLPFEDGRFTAVVCFTMLHHVRTPQMQDDLFTQARRVLRPGGVFAGSDTVASSGLSGFHDGDVHLPVDPAGLLTRLRAAGFVRRRGLGAGAGVGRLPGPRPSQTGNAQNSLPSGSASTVQGRS